MGYLCNEKPDLFSVVDEALQGDADEATRAKYAKDNRKLYYELVQVLDDKTNEIIGDNYENDGRALMNYLEQKFRGSDTPALLSYYHEWTTLKMETNEAVVDYIARAESAISGLKSCGTVLSETLKMASVLHGLPRAYASFITVHEQMDKLKTLEELKTHLEKHEKTLQNFETSPEIEEPGAVASVIKTVKRKVPKCYGCGEKGHKKNECKLAGNLYCNVCNKSGHNAKACRAKGKKKGEMHGAVSMIEINDTKFCKRPVNKCKSMVDSGCSKTVINCKSMFKSFKELKGDEYVVKLANGEIIDEAIEGYGDAVMSMEDNEGKVHEVRFSNVLYSSKFPMSLISVAQSCKTMNASFHFDTFKGTSYMLLDGKRYNMTQIENLFYLEMQNDVQVNVVRTASEWHKVFAHVSQDTIAKMPAWISDMEISEADKKSCENCIKGKMRRENIGKGHIANSCKPLEVIHTDTCEMPIVSKGGYKYVVIFLDDFSGFNFLYLLKRKSDSHLALKLFLNQVKSSRIDRLHTDCGKEYVNEQFIAVLTNHGIQHTTSTPYVHNQNGKAERCFRTLTEAARCLLLESRLEQKYWDYAVRYANLVRNFCPGSQNANMSKHELFYGKKPSADKLKIFGEVCLSYDERQKTKLDDRCRLGYFLGIDSKSGSYYFLDGETERVCITNSIKTVKEPKTRQAYEEEAENDVFPAEIPPPDRSQILEGDLEHDDSYIGHVIENQNFDTTDAISEESNINYDYDDDAGDGENNIQPDITRPQRDIQRPKHLADYEVDWSGACWIGMCKPESYQEAVNGKNAVEWQKAIDYELQALAMNNTWNIVDKPEKGNIISPKWVFAIKGDETLRARLVAKGCSQRYGIDYEDVFSPTVNKDTLRLMLQVAVNNQYVIHQIDVKSAYLNGNIDADIYMNAPEGMQIPDGKCLKLKKSLYGLKQSGKIWNGTLSEILMKDLNFRRSSKDPCLFMKKGIFIGIWVDDIVICCENEDKANEFKREMAGKIQIDDRGQISEFLGMDFTYENGQLSISQEKYVNKLLNEFGMMQCKPVATPMVLGKAVKSTKLCDTNYRKLIGGLLYVATNTRPDISFSVAYLSRSLNNPSVTDWEYAKRILRYLKGTKHYKLIYTKMEKNAFKAFSDADFANDEDRKSVSGFVIFGSAPIAWASRKQTTVAQSTCEAEYIALNAVVNLQRFVGEIYRELTGLEFNVINCVDNQSAMKIAKSLDTKRSKHFDVRYHATKEYFATNKKDLHYVESKFNRADGFTKPLPHEGFKQFCKYLNFLRP